MNDIPPLGTNVDSTTVQRWLARGDNVLLLDVRTPAEFEAVHIPGSYNLPLDQLGEHKEELGHHLREPVVIVCRSGNRATQAERLLAEDSTSTMRVLEGGILAWEASGGAVRRGRQRWDLERQVRLVAGSLVLTAVLGSLVFEPAKWIAAAIGAGLTVAALSNSCLMGMLLSKLPYNRGAACDASVVVAQLSEAQGAGRS